VELADLRRQDGASMNEEQSDQQDDLRQDQRDGQLLTAMVQQPHGGAIQKGGNRRPKEPTAADVRALCRKRFYRLVPAANRKARKAEKDADQLRAMELLARYGMGDTVSLSDLRLALSATMDVLDEVLPTDLAVAVKQRLGPIWLRVWAA